MPVRTLKFFRQTHLYVGIFISPALLFFALSGALQTFRLHELTAGSTYRPPAWVLTLAAIHKHQTSVALPLKEPDAAAGSSAKAAHKSGALHAAAPAAPAPAAATAKHLPMQIFFLVVAIGLFTSTLTGIYMAYKYNRSKPLVTGLLFAGIAVPLVLLLF